MTFSNLLSDINFLCGSTSATYLNADKTRNINIAYHDVARLIWDSAGGWQYDDSNATTLPIARATLVHNQQDYSLPTNAMRLERVEVKDSNGNYTKLKQFDIHDVKIGMDEYLETAGLPIYYDVIGRSLLLYPKPSSAYVTLISGLSVYLSRSVTEFPTTATTTEPGFVVPFHRILSYAASLDFLQDSQQRQFLITQKAKLEQGLIRFYSSANVERRSAIRPASKRTWRRYT